MGKKGWVRQVLKSGQNHNHHYGNPQLSGDAKSEVQTCTIGDCTATISRAHSCMSSGCWCG